LPLIARLRNEKKLSVETLAETGKWFHENFKTTPATSVTVMKDIDGSDRKTVWFDSRFYRANLLWEDNTLRFRDIHLFDEDFSSDYVDAKGTSTKCDFYTLPVVDGFNWSSTDVVAGLRFKTVADGEEKLMQGEMPVVRDSVQGKLNIYWPLKSAGNALVIDMDEKQLEITLEGDGSVQWYIDLTTSGNAQLPFEEVFSRQMNCRFKGMDYNVFAGNGNFSEPGDGIDLRMVPENDRITLNFAPPKNDR